MLSNPIIPTCVDQLNGKYMCSYQASYPGPHELHIKLLNYSTSQPGGLGLHAAYYAGVSAGDGTPEFAPDVVHRIDPGLSFSWATGYALPLFSIGGRLLRTGAQFIRWDGFVLSPRSDNFTFSIEADMIDTTLYIDNVLIWDS